MTKALTHQFVFKPMPPLKPPASPEALEEFWAIMRPYFVTKIVYIIRKEEDSEDER